ncbi:MAG: carboxyl-terminal protease [Ignavibacteria bacterium]|nr:carboxyl-terminal protease [Ignavibacteria bacterium]
MKNNINNQNIIKRLTELIIIVIKKFDKKSALLLVLGGALFLVSFTDSALFKINKSFDVFGAVFREISANYVDEIDPEDLMKLGIEGLLSNLDPYTTFYTETEADDLEVITNGVYTGIGITVGVQDSMLTILGLSEGFSAQRNGVRIGDRLYKIDTTIVLSINSQELRKYTRGAPGSPVNVWVIRDGVPDTLHYKLKREQIQLKNIAYAKIIYDSIAYIKLERFTRSTGDEMQRAIANLKNSGRVRGMILDLRDNPGGLLEAAVDVCELFVPKGSLIVSTKGRSNESRKSYKSTSDPIEPTLPLAVLIDDGSASASEIVAGAIQDLDRGIIIGRRSYGKGLVQSVFDMPYKGNLKITTARYYTPSGRCIQKSDFAVRLNKKLSDTATNHGTGTFYTINGRKVTENKGISPDSLINEEKYPDFVREMLKNSIFFNFANQFAAKLDSLPKEFKVVDEVLEQLKLFIEKRNFLQSTPLVRQIKKARQLAEEEKLSTETINEFKNLESSILLEEKHLIDTYTEQISDILDYEISSRLTTQAEAVARQIKYDKDIRAAIGLVNSKKYRQILAVKDK